jgi:hypothetical protein
MLDSGAQCLSRLLATGPSFKTGAVSSLAAFDKFPAEEIASAADYGTRIQTDQNST